MEKKWDRVSFGRGDFNSFLDLVKRSKLQWRVGNGSQVRHDHFDQIDVHYLVDKNGNKDPRMIMLSYMGHYFDIAITYVGDEYDFDLIERIEDQISWMGATYNQSIENQLDTLKDLRDVYEKTKNGVTLTREELEFLYESRKRLRIFANEEKPLTDLIKSKRSLEEDILDLGITSFTPKTYTRFDLDKVKDSRCFKNIKNIKGMIDFKSLTDVEGFSNLTTLEGYFSFPNVTSSKGLENLSKIKGYVDFSSLKDTSGFKKLKQINGALDLSGLGDSYDLSFIRKYEPYDAARVNELLDTYNGERIARGYEYYRETFKNRFLEYCKKAGIKPDRDTVIEGRLITPANKSLVYKKGE